MKKMLFGLLLVSGAVLAQDVYVVGAQPRYVTVQQQQCHVVNVTENNSGIGTVLGAVAGGVIGHQVGRGLGVMWPLCWVPVSVLQWDNALDKINNKQ